METYDDGTYHLHLMLQFHTAQERKAQAFAFAQKRVRLMHIPPRSPDLNSIESFWGWLRGELRRRDRKDLRLQKPALNMVQYKQRVKEVLRTVKAQDVAKAKFRNLKKVCREVVKKKGAMSRQ